MADNSSIPVASGNETFANEDVGSVKYPLPKLAWGAAGTVNKTDVASGKALPVQRKQSPGQGVGLTWTDAIGTALLNTLNSTFCVLSDVVIANGTALDQYMDLSLVLASLTTPNTVGLNISIHLYPLNEAAAYGDGRFGTAVAGPCNYPPSAVIPLIVNLATTGQTGQATGVVIPPGSFKVVVCNNAGVNFAGSGNTLKYRTYN